MLKIFFEAASVEGITFGYAEDGMPIGLQIMSPQLSEAKLFNIAYKFEQAHDYYRQLANI